MKRFKGWMCGLVGASLSLAATDVMAQSVVVYENITDPLLNADQSVLSGEVGNEITLAGDARVVTRIELAIPSTTPTAQVVVRFYENDGAATGLGQKPRAATSKRILVVLCTSVTPDSCDG